MTQSTHLIDPASISVITDAIKFITSAHSGQKYGLGPYFYHPIEVANRIDAPTLDEYIAALLHDVIEDTTYNSVDLRNIFPDVVIDMVDLLTKNDALSYRENIQRIIDSGNVGAMKVKLADNRVNFGGDKSDMSNERRNRLQKKYKMSIKMLEKAIDETVD